MEANHCVTSESGWESGQTFGRLWRCFRTRPRWPCCSEHLRSRELVVFVFFVSELGSNLSFKYFWLQKKQDCDKLEASSIKPTGDITASQLAVGHGPQRPRYRVGRLPDRLQWHKKKKQNMWWQCWAEPSSPVFTLSVHRHRHTHWTSSSKYEINVFTKYDQIWNIDYF